MEGKEGEESGRRGHKARGCAVDGEAAARPRQKRCIIVSGCLLIGQADETTADFMSHSQLSDSAAWR